MSKRGQITIAMVGAVTSIVVALISGSFAATRTASDEVEQVRVSLESKDRETVQRVATLEESVKSLKEKTDETNRDVKEILRILR